MMFNNSWKDPREAETVAQRRERKSKTSEGPIRSSDSGLASGDISRPSRLGKLGGFRAFRRLSKGDDDSTNISPTQRVRATSFSQSPLETMSDSAIAELPATPRDEAQRPPAAPPRVINPDGAKKLLPNANALSAGVAASTANLPNTVPGEYPLLDSLYQQQARELNLNKLLSPIYTSQDPPAAYKIPKPVVRRKPPANVLSGPLPPAPMVRDIAAGDPAGGILSPPDRPVSAAQRDPSTHLTHHQQDHKTLFQRVLHRMRIAGGQVLCSRLNENWYVADSKVREEISFEKRLWALTALGVVGATVEVTEKIAGREGRKDILNLYGHVADGWHLAANNPSAIVHSIPSRYTSLFSPDSSTWGSPPTNLNQLSACPPVGQLPYPDAFFDLIFTDSPYTTHRSHDVPTLLQECVRVLKPGGCIVITAFSPMPHPAGPLLQRWMFSNLFLGLERKFSVTQPTQLLASLLQDMSELTQLEIKTFAFTAVIDGGVGGSGLALSSDSATQEEKDGPGQLRSIVGLFLYRSLFEHFISDAVPTPTMNRGITRTASAWWWEDTTIASECKEQRSVFELLTYCYQKKHQY